MSDPNTIRVLELDGGGERGYLSLNFLEKFVQEWGINPEDIAKNFDVICGTSIGGIMALGFALGLTPAAISPFFTVEGPNIFTLGTNGIPPATPPIIPSIRPSSVYKVTLMLANTPFYSSSGTYADQYGAGLLAATMNNIYGTNTLQNLQTNVLIPTFEYISKKFVLCSNLNYPGFSAQNELVTNVALATSAAPVYLPSLVVNNTGAGRLNGTYIDGGVYQNNPASLGLTLGQMIKPNANRACVLSLGTGSGNYGFDNDPTTFMDSFMAEADTYPEGTTFRDIFERIASPEAISRNINNRALNVRLTDTFATFSLLFELFSIASAGAQESVAQGLLLESSYTLNQLYYYRFQPPLDLSLDPSLDNTEPAILTYYQNLAITTFNNDIEAISTFIGHLTA